MPSPRPVHCVPCVPPNLCVLTARDVADRSPTKQGVRMGWGGTFTSLKRDGVRAGVTEGVPRGASACLVCVLGQIPRPLGFACTRAFALGPRLSACTAARSCVLRAGGRLVHVASAQACAQCHATLTSQLFLPYLQTQSFFFF